MHPPYHAEDSNVPNSNVPNPALKSAIRNPQSAIRRLASSLATMFRVGGCGCSHWIKAPFALFFPGKFRSFKRVSTLVVALCVLGVLSATFFYVRVGGAGPITVTATAGTLGPTDYATVKGAFDAINAGTHRGTISITVVGDTTETASAVLNASGSGSASYTSIGIQPSGGAARTITGNITAPLIDLNGADNVTIDGLNTGNNALTISNTNAGSAANICAIRFINDATNNTVQNSTILGSETLSGGFVCGTIFFSTGTSSGNDGNVITNNSIGPAGSNLPVAAIFSNGTVSPTALNNSGVQITNNKIFDFFATTNSASGINVNGGSTDWTITGNSFYQTASRAGGSGGILNPIVINTGDNHNIAGNFIGGTAANVGGTPLTVNGTAAAYKFIGIQLNVGTTTATNVQNNTIANISFISSSTAILPGVWSGILINGGNVNIGTTLGNTIGSATGTGSITANASGGTGTSVGIANAGSGTVSISNNTIGSLNIVGATASGNSSTTNGHSFNGIQVTAGTNTISGNTIGSTTTANSINASGTATSNAQSVTGINGFSSTVSTAITNNTIANLNNATTGTVATSQVRGIATSVGVNTITGNTVRNLSTPSASAGNQSASPVLGISQTATVAGQTVSQNTVLSLSTSDVTAATNLYGIYYSGPGSGSNLVARNFVHSLSVASPNGLQVGIYARAGVATYLNNMVRLGIDAAGNSTGRANIIGINADTTAANFYFNSVFIGGSVANGNDTVAFICQTSDVRDNAFVNGRSTTSGAGKNYSYQLLNTVGTSDYNIYLANGTGGVLASIGFVDRPTLSAIQSATGQDSHSLTADPLFKTPNGTSSTVDLHITNPSINGPSPASNSGTTISGVTNDFDNDTRGVSTPDIGADEFDQAVTINASVNLPAGSYTSITVDSPAVVTLTGNITVTGSVTVNNGGTLNCGTFIISGGGTFTLNSGGTLGIGDPNGITSGTTASGNIQLTGGRTFSTGANYTYNGSANQAVGNGLPSTVANLTIANTGGSGSNTVTGNSGQIVTALLRVQSGVFSTASTFNDVQIDSGATLSLAGPISLSGNWTDAGTFTPNGQTVTFNGTGTNQFVTRTGGGTETFSSIALDKPSGLFAPNNGPATSLTINGTSGDVFQIFNLVSLQLNGQTVTFAGNGGNILTSGLSHGVQGQNGTLLFTGSKTITSSGGSTMFFASDCTVALAAAVNFGAGISTIAGTLRMDSGGSVNTNPPSYNSGSVLKYNSGGTFGRGTEWSATSGAGYPSNVQVSNNTTLDLGANGGTATARQIAVNLTIDSGSTLSMAVSPMTAALTVLGDIAINGTLALSTSSGGDVHLSGNWNDSGTFTPNDRAAYFDGTGTNQFVTRTGGGTETFARIVLNKPSGLFANNNAPATNITINGTSGDVMQIFNVVSPQMNSQTMTFAGNGGNILTSGLNHGFSGPNGTLAFTGSKTVTSSGGGTMFFNSDLTVVLSATVDFGAGISTIAGTLRIDSGGSVNTNPPTYNGTSLLKYNSTGTYGRAVEWSATSGAGFPNDVRISNNTTLDLGNGGASTARSIARDLTIDSGSTLTMAATAMTAALTVPRNVSNGGTLTLSTLSGGDMNVAGNWANTGTFTPNGRTVTLNGNGNTQTLTGNSTFSNLTINHTGANGVTAAGSTLAVTGLLHVVSGTFTSATQYGDVTIDNGATLSLSGDISVSGTWTNNGTFNANGFTVTFNGSLNQPIGGSGPTTFSGLNISNAAGVTLAVSTTVAGTLTLQTGDIFTASFTLFMGNGATSAGTGDVVGSVNRGDLNGGATRSFGNPDVQMTETAGTVTDMTVKLVKGVTPNDFSNSVRRIYTITPNNGTNLVATVRLHYLDGELNNNSEVMLDLWRKTANTWLDQMQTTRHDDTSGDQNWVELSAVSQFSDWTLANNNIVPTAVDAVLMKATRYDNRVLLEWQTGYEVNNVGFNIYRERNGNLERVTREPVAGSALIAGPGVVLTTGFAYSLWDEGIGDCRSSADCQNLHYFVEDLDLTGRTTTHGPFAVELAPPDQTPPPGKGQAPLLSGLGSDASFAGSTAPVEPKANAIKPTPALEAAQAGLASQTVVKLSVQHEGWYRVELADLRAAGFPAGVDPQMVQLFVDGEQVPIVVTAGDPKPSWTGIEFYGIGIDSPSTANHIYWLVAGSQPGARITPVGASGGSPAAAAFSYTVERRDRVVYFPALKNGGGEKFFGPLVFNAQPTDQSLVLQHVAVGGANATLEVSVQGFTAAHHSVRVLLNGTELGTLQFDGLAKGTAQYSIAQSALKEGSNQVQLISPAGFSDISMSEYVRLTYLHTNDADNNSLRFPAAGSQQVTVKGFTDSNLRLIDVTVPGSPQELAGTVTTGGTGFSITANVPGTGARTLLAFAPDQQKKPAAMAANQPSNWRDPSRAGDYIVITRRDLIDSLGPLVAHRKGQGLTPAVVDIEDVYDEFSFGNKTPQALKDFINYAKGSWAKPPRFVVLAGGATYDPKNYTGFGDFDLVPTKLVETAFNETATDDWFVDVNNDGLPDIPVGRLPVRTPDETAALVSKIVGYDDTVRTRSVLLVADRNSGFDFEAANTQLRSLIPAKVPVTDIRRGQVGDSDARSQLLNAINQGQRLVNYYGHGSTRLWTDAQTLTAADAANFVNVGHLSLFVSMTCLTGFFHDPAIESLGQSLLKAQGGAIAVWASSGLTDATAQVVMNQAAIKQLLGPLSTKSTIGEHIMRAKGVISDVDVRRTWILLGDPATRLK